MLNGAVGKSADCGAKGSSSIPASNDFLALDQNYQISVVFAIYQLGIEDIPSEEMTGCWAALEWIQILSVMTAEAPKAQQDPHWPWLRMCEMEEQLFQAVRESNLTWV